MYVHINNEILLLIKGYSLGPHRVIILPAYSLVVPPLWWIYGIPLSLCGVMHHYLPSRMLHLMAHERTLFYRRSSFVSVDCAFGFSMQNCVSTTTWKDLVVKNNPYLQLITIAPPFYKSSGLVLEQSSSLYQILEFVCPPMVGRI